MTDPNYPPTTAECIPTDYTGASCPPEYVPVTTIEVTHRTGAPLADTGADLGMGVSIASVLLIFGTVAVAIRRLQKTKTEQTS